MQRAIKRLTANAFSSKGGLLDCEAGGKTRTCDLTFTKRSPYQLGTPAMVAGNGLEPLFTEHESVELPLLYPAILSNNNVNAYLSKQSPFFTRLKVPMTLLYMRTIHSASCL